MFLRLLYFFLRILCTIFAHVFYRITFFNKENLLLPKGPCIMTVNHPNTLMDVITTAPFVNRNTHFLANASLFINPILNWLFRKLWCIPIKRKKDEDSKVKNEDSFEECDNFLSNGGLLFIAPEGSSKHERHIRDFRPGTAIIAFRAEEKNNFNLGLKICPIGLTYERPWQFRSRMYVQAGKPIRIADYQSIYESKPEEAIEQLTLELEQQTRIMTVDTDNPNHDRMLGVVEKIDAAVYYEKYHRWPHSIQRFDNAQRRCHQLREIENSNQNALSTLQTSLTEYSNLINQYEISENALAISKYPLAVILKIFLIVIGIPLFLTGLVLNIVPFVLTEVVWRSLRYPDYEATVRIVVGGLLFFPICYGLGSHIVCEYLNLPYFGILFWIISVLMGIFAYNYFKNLKLLLKIVTVLSLSKEQLTLLLQKRKDILEELKIPN
ncbi:MAG: 1-acyl-sn-glycerol-3-phosphate acyltransferase [Saprospiraceae bacterium]